MGRDVVATTPSESSPPSLSKPKDVAAGIPAVISSLSHGITRMGMRCWCKAGSSKPPKATMVMPEAPVRAVKRAHTKIAIMAKPPGNQPSRACEKFTRRAGALLAASVKPVRAKSGIAVKVGVSAIRYISMKMIVRSISAKKKCNKARAPITANNGVPERAAKIATRLLIAARKSCVG